MKVLFAAASTSYARNMEVYERIKKQIQALGHEVYFDGQDATAVESTGSVRSLDDDDWKVLCDREVGAAQECDAAIFDVSDKATFGVGFMASICVSKGTPTLFLLRDDTVGGSFVSGLQRACLQRKSFNTANVAGKVRKFLEGVRV